MYIKQVILDGFKSYATRTVINGWDQQFNAITGLNGSGKSNILDSICFVLGISKLDQVRVQNLQQLVYKEGQARVTKASVTIVFDNRDKKGSPVGYDQYDDITVTRTVVIGGRNKYLINGTNAQQTRVKDLFHSIQLDVNNPHFLIMQGRITKVLNMKPPEILGMIEEAAGTKMYEQKKQKALQTMRQKEHKVTEIDKILTEEITPQLDQLRKERTHYMTWSANNTDIQRAERFVIAWQYVQAKEGASGANEKLKGFCEEKESLDSDAANLQKVIDADTAKIKELTDKKAEEESGQLKHLEDKAQELNKEVAILKAQVKNAVREVSRGEDKLKKTEQGILDSKSAQVEQEKKMQEAKVRADEAEEVKNKLDQELKELRGQQLGMSTGDDGGAGSLPQQLMEARKEVSTHEGDMKGISGKAKRFKAQIRKKEAEAKKGQDEVKRLTKQRDDITNKVKHIDDTLAKMNAPTEDLDTLEQKQEELEEEVYNISKNYERYKGICSKMQFDYDRQRLPGSFNHNKVKGMVARLVKMKDDKNAIALQTAAGGKLYNVVVQDAITAQTLLDKANLQKRRTFLPMDKVKSKKLGDAQLQRAKQIASNRGVECHLALDLIEYDPSVRKAMEYVFGNCLVTSDMDTAEKICFDKGVRCRVVTLDGEDFNPEGILSGGSRKKSEEALKALARYLAIESDLQTKHGVLTNMKKQLDVLKKNKKQLDTFRYQREVLAKDLDVLKEKMEQSEAGRLMMEVEEMRKELGTCETRMKELGALLDEGTAKIKDLERKLKEFEDNKEKMMKEIKSKIKDKTKELKAHVKNTKAIMNEYQQLKVLVESTNTEAIKSTAELEECKKNIADARETLEKLQGEEKVKKEEHGVAVEALKQAKEALARHDTQIREMKKKVAEISKKRHEFDIKIQKLSKMIDKWSGGAQFHRNILETLMRENNWISQEEGLFGQSGTDYDFKNRNPKKVSKQLEKMKAEQEQLSRKINKKVMGMFERAENEYNDLMRKKQIVNNDKKKIEAVIEELDKKKNETLQATYKKVTKSLGVMFGRLLPGSDAKLIPPEGTTTDPATGEQRRLTILDGLCVRVAFGGKWLGSLTQLSGGQRSLLALSLILALLLFKPAPMYILDEIDAALDLSHTQNIGQMLKEHFGQSQFIVVSLKEGMFNNANVVFRTKFVDGVSTVTRTTPKVRGGQSG